MAWLSATPKEQTGSRRSQIDHMAELHGIDPEYQLPELDEAEYLVAALSEIGEAKLSGDRLVPIGWVDIDAWIGATGSRMTPGELVGLTRLSSAYVNQHYEAQDPACVSPNIVELPPTETVVDKMKSLFSMLRR